MRITFSDNHYIFNFSTFLCYNNNSKEESVMLCFKILIVDDEKMVRRMIARLLESEGMLTFEASNGTDAIRMVKGQEFDLIILDIVMEGMNGFEVINELRSLGKLTPVFVLSGRQADNDKVFALGIGADDYVTKPFSTNVLCAKVKACLRRTHIAESKSVSIETGPFRYRCDEMRLFKNDKEIFLSSKESFMMKYFMSNSGMVLTKEQIYSNVWGTTWWMTIPSWCISAVCAPRSRMIQTSRPI